MEDFSNNERIVLSAEEIEALGVVQGHISKYDFIKIGQKYNAITIARLAEVEYDSLYTALERLGVYPWIEDESDGTFTLVLERQRELARLHSLVDALEESTSAKPVATDTEPVQTLLQDEYRFPLPPSTRTPGSRKGSGPRKRAIKEPAEKENDEAGIDTELADIINTFDEGISGEEVEDVVNPERKRPRLELFKRKYFFRDGGIFDGQGNEISLEEHREIILNAKNGPEEMKRAVEMSTGLVVAVVQRVLEKYSTHPVVSADDLLQAGMEGLLYGLERIESRETKPSSYLVPCIEGHVRRELARHKSGFRRPEYQTQQLNQYYKTKRLLERDNPDFYALSLHEQHEKIAEKSRLPLQKIEELYTLSQLSIDEFDDEEGEHNELVSENSPMIDIEDVDYQTLREKIRISLDSLEPRHDLALRLYFGLTDASPRWGVNLQNTYKDMIGDGSHKSAIERGSLGWLINSDIDTLQQRELNPAERVFLVLIGKLPESSIADIETQTDGSPSAVTLDDVSALFGTQRERVRQIIAKALRLMKNPARSRPLKQFMDESAPDVRKNWRHRFDY